MSKRNPNGIDHLARVLYGAAFAVGVGAVSYTVIKAMENTVPVLEFAGAVIALIGCYMLGYAIEKYSGVGN